jgi:predicted DNA-binding protein (MmcQ/YjbR family)
MSQTPHQRAEAELIAYGLTLPETDVVPWATADSRYMRVKGKGFAVFGHQAQADELRIVLKLPISYEMIQDLPFVRPSQGWNHQHKWATVFFGPDDDPLGEMETLKGWIRQSYQAAAPKKLGRLTP